MPAHFSVPDDDLYCLVSSNERVAFSVKGNPIPKSRAGRNRFGRTYNPDQRTEAQFAQVVKQQFTEATGSVPRFSETQNLIMAMEFHIPVSGRNQQEHERSLRARGDVDNFAKFVQDALQDCLYANDKQIIEIRAKKIGWTNKPVGHVLVDIRTINQPLVHSG